MSLFYTRTCCEQQAEANYVRKVRRNADIQGRQISGLVPVIGSCPELDLPGFLTLTSATAPIQHLMQEENSGCSAQPIRRLSV